MILTRRQLLSSSVAAGAAIVVSGSAGPVRAAPRTLRKWVDPLAVPAVVTGEHVRLSMITTRHSFSSSLPGPTPTMAYVVTGQATSDAYLGPTIVATTGVPLTVTMTNSLGAHPLQIDPAIHGSRPSDGTSPRASTHLHGGNTRPEHDGGPEDDFGVGRTHVYEYDNSQDAAGLWYHDHALALTRLNVYAGLAGGYLVRDTPETGIDTGAGTLLPAGVHEIPLVIQDKTFNADGSLFYPHPWAPEFFGDTAVVNGVVFPYLSVDRGVYRFRVVNGSNARFYRLAFNLKATGATLPFFQIGTDGGLLNSPVPLGTLLIAPGERADLLVDFRGLPPGSLVDLTNNAVAPFPSGARSGHKGGAPLPQIMQFRVTAATGWVPPADAPVHGMDLRPVTPIQPLVRSKAARTRTRSLVEIMGAAGPRMALLDNRPFHSTDYADLDDPVRPGTTEVWELVNTTVDAHPIHLHLVQFQVLDRQPVDTVGYLREAGYRTTPEGWLVEDTGRYPAPSVTDYLLGQAAPPAANERGWKDTVVAPPGMVTRILVPFGSEAGDGLPVAARAVHVPGRRDNDYVWHCHILEHEENDMMQYYKIEAP